MDISQFKKISPSETVYEVLKTGYIRVASFNMKESHINNFMKQEWAVTGSDGNTGHPRKYGSFPRRYNHYVESDSIIELSFFINNSTYKTAEIFNIKDPGVIKKGYFADIILFDPSSFNPYYSWVFRHENP